MEKSTDFVIWDTSFHFVSFSMTLGATVILNEVKNPMEENRRLRIKGYFITLCSIQYDVRSVRTCVIVDSSLLVILREVGQILSKEQEDKH